MAETGSPDRTTQRPGPPAPTLTHGFLFADLRDYTGYVDARGDHAAADLLDRYRSLVRNAVAAIGGAEIRTEGDGFYVVFDSASAAVRCGMAIVAAAGATADGPGDAIRVGVGVHAGETVATAEGYVGSAVNIAARSGAKSCSPGSIRLPRSCAAVTRACRPSWFSTKGWETSSWCGWLATWCWRIPWAASSMRTYICTRR